MTLTSRHVTTAKPRRCFGCGRTMLTGTLMRRASEDASEDAGVHLIIKTWWCMACERYRDELLDADDKVYPGEIRSEDPQRWERFRVRVEAELTGAGETPG